MLVLLYRIDDVFEVRYTTYCIRPGIYEGFLQCYNPHGWACCGKQYQRVACLVLVSLLWWACGGINIIQRSEDPKIRRPEDPRIPSTCTSQLNIQRYSRKSSTRYLVDIIRASCFRLLECFSEFCVDGRRPMLQTRYTW